MDQPDCKPCSGWRRRTAPLTMEDITEIKRAQDEALARQKLESVGTLASGIAHDFNNLLGGVLAQAELALGELAAGSRRVEELKAIRGVALRGSEIIRELMIYAEKRVRLRVWSICQGSSKRCSNYSRFRCRNTP